MPTDEVIVFERKLSQHRWKVIMLPVMLAGVYQTHLIMGLVASIPMGAFTIFVGFMIRRFFTIPYATVDK